MKYLIRRRWFLGMVALLAWAGAGTASASIDTVTINSGIRNFGYSNEINPETIGGLLATSYNAAGPKHFDTGPFRSSTADRFQGLGWRDKSTAREISVAATLYGDASVDGTVNLSDLTLLGQSWSGAGKVWAQGDFNYDGSVNLSDLTLLGQNWGKSIGPLSVISAAAVPEPATLIIWVLLGAAGIGLAWRRKRAR